MAILCDLALQKPNVLSFQSVVGASAITVGRLALHFWGEKSPNRWNIGPFF